MKHEFFDAIRKGRKVTTLRHWHRPRMRAGQRVCVPGLGRVMIQAVEEIQDLSTLTDTDAQADGFNDAPALLAALREIYPPEHMTPRTRKWFKVTFELVAETL